MKQLDITIIAKSKFQYLDLEKGRFSGISPSTLGFLEYQNREKTILKI